MSLVGGYIRTLELEKRNKMKREFIQLKYLWENIQTLVESMLLLLLLVVVVVAREILAWFSFSYCFMGV